MEKGTRCPRPFSWIPLILVVWVLFIFGTSCTVIRPLEFFAAVQKYFLVNPTSFEQFKVFWGLSWFVIVKGWHVVEFAVLLLLCVAVWKWWFGQFDSYSIIGAMIVCVLFAISDEWHQSFVPDRFGTVSDVLIDSMGVGITGLMLLRRARTKAATC